MGLVRTALFNWAFARHTGGTLVFRIEDTDAARDSEESYEQLLDSLRWLGLDWDEGPEVGRPARARTASRSAWTSTRTSPRKLLDAGHAYHCYCTAGGAGGPPRGRPRGRQALRLRRPLPRRSPPSRSPAYEAEGREPIVRFRMPDEPITFTDLVRGELTFTPENVPDYGIVRANGAPLYTLVNPVDDALMEITHVLRGEDLLSSTPRQIALYKALIELGIAKAIPAFGHLPYVMGEGNKKLSKRDPQSSLNLYRERGFLPEGLLNYLSLLGWSLSADQDVFSIDEMVAAFDIADVNANPARFDLKKCEAINADHIRLLDVKAFIEACGPWLKAPHAPWAPEDFDQAAWEAIAPHAQTRLTVLSDITAERRLPLPGRAGRGRGVLDEGDEGGLGRTPAHGPREAGRRRLDEPGVAQGGRPGGRRGARPQARQGPGPGPRRRHRPHGRPAALRVPGGPGQGEDPGPHRRGPGQADRVAARTAGRHRCRVPPRRVVPAAAVPASALREGPGPLQPVQQPRRTRGSSPVGVWRRSPSRERGCGRSHHDDQSRGLGRRRHDLRLHHGRPRRMRGHLAAEGLLDGYDSVEQALGRWREITDQQWARFAAGEAAFEGAAPRPGAGLPGRGS